MIYTEILDLIQRNTNTQNTTTSSYPLAAKTVDVNNALNQYFILANSVGGNFRPVDDTNQVDYPIMKADVTINKQDYLIYLDATNNQVLEIYKVRLLLPDGVTWVTLKQIDQDTIDDDDLQTVVSGIPSEYYVNSNGIFLVQKPNYNMTEGVEVWFNRTPTYFTVSDTTKKAGIPWVHHEYLALRPSYFYCLQKGLPQAVDFRLRLFGNDGRGGMEEDIKKYYRDRNKDFQSVLSPQQLSTNDYE